MTEARHPNTHTKLTPPAASAKAMVLPLSQHRQPLNRHKVAALSLGATPTALLPELLPKHPSLPLQKHRITTQRRRPSNIPFPCDIFFFSMILWGGLNNLCYISTFICTCDIAYFLPYNKFCFSVNQS
jgi:hypothetical protein